MAGRLHVCATPIGNLEDVTLRLLRVLGEVDLVAAEDTRRTAKLLSAHQLHARMVSYHDANERSRLPELMEQLRSGHQVALVTDAGMPSVSDPGYHLVSACLEEGIAVEVVPGPSAVLTALVASGLPPARFAFEGFLPRKGGDRARRLRSIAGDDRTLVF
ncbi:MAG: 16S rRNA (cytidine(1402)-2'-O)-methyltransferase, partial [Actinomycetota bacterium]